jgi:hypothetical protein
MKPITLICERIFLYELSIQEVSFDIEERLNIEIIHWIRIEMKLILI